MIEPQSQLVTVMSHGGGLPHVIETRKKSDRDRLMMMRSPSGRAFDCSPRVYSVGRGSFRHRHSSQTFSQSSFVS